MPLPAGKARVEGVEQGLRGNLGGWLIARARSDARRAREGRQAARIVVVRHDGGELSVVLELSANGQRRIRGHSAREASLLARRRSAG
jgi:hypothetical protein